MARFIGGPCDGQTAPSDVYAQRQCGGVTYTIGEDGNYHVPGGLPGFGSTGIPAVNTKQVGRAWHRITHALGVEAPHAIRRAQAARARVRRLSK